MNDFEMNDAQPGQGQPRSNTALWVVCAVIAVCAVGAIAYKVVVRGVSAAKAVAAQRQAAVDEQAAAAEDAKLSSLMSTLQTLNSQTALYRLQHLDNFPDFRNYKDWAQFTGRTYADGRPYVGTPRPGQQLYGPYMQMIPVNPLNNLSEVAAVDQDPQPGDAVTPPAGGSGKAGFVFSAATGRWWGTDASGLKVADHEGAMQRTQARREAQRFANAPAAQKDVAFVSTLQTLRSQNALYMLQHNDNYPDFKTHGWNQFLNKTESDGSLGRNGRYGPYMMSIPRNPYNGFSNIEVTSDPSAGPGYRPKGSQVGWVFETNTNKLWGTDANGVVVAQ